METKNGAFLSPVKMTLIIWAVISFDAIAAIPSINQIAAMALSLLVWLSGAAGILRIIRKQNSQLCYYKNSPFSSVDYMTLFFVLTGGISIAASNYFYGGLSPLFVREFLNGYLLYTIRNLLYYPTEVLLMLELLICAQKGGELMTQTRHVSPAGLKEQKAPLPWGAFALFVMWGLPHIFYHGPVDGMISALRAFIYCIPFYTSGKNIKTSYISMLILWLL